MPNSVPWPWQSASSTRITEPIATVAQAGRVALTPEGERPGARPDPPGAGVDLAVCMVGPHYPRPGGTSTQVELLSRRLRAEGVDVRSVDTNVQAVRRLGAAGRVFMPFAQVIVVPWRLWRAARGADLIHAHLASFWGFWLPVVVSLAVGRIRNVPVLATYHGGRAAAFVSRNRRSVRWLLSRVAALVVLSPYTGNVFADLGLRPVVIPNLVETEQFAPLTSGYHHGAGPENSVVPPQPDLSASDGPAILWIKSFDAVGNPQQMVRVFATLRQRFPAVTLTMIGQGPQRAETEAVARSLGVTVDFAGSVPFERMKYYYQHAYVFASTSTVDNQPCTFLEASASGLPIIASAVGGIPDMVTDGENALLVPPGDDEAFVAAITRVVEDPALAARLRHGALENAQRFAWPAVWDRLRALYLSVLPLPASQAVDSWQTPADGEEH